MSQCVNVFTHILYWMTHTLQFQTTIVLVSSPLALVALWGMTPKHMLYIVNWVPLVIRGSNKKIKFKKRTH